jgi:hypothetical protein
LISCYEIGGERREAMGILDFLKGLKLIDVQNQLKAKQMGLINVEVEVNNYHFTLQNGEELKKFSELKITPEIETQALETTRAKLAPIEEALKYLPDTIASAVVTSVAASSAVDVSSSTHLTTSEEVRLKIR